MSKSFILHRLFINILIKYPVYSTAGREYLEKFMIQQVAWDLKNEENN